MNTEELDHWIERHRLVAGTLGPTLPGRPRRTNVQLLEAVLGLPGWDLEKLAIQLGASVAKIESWYQGGVPNYYVPRLRTLLELGSGPAL